MTCTIHVRTPCRLHFGMFCFRHSDRTQFGGVGVMIDPPAVDLTIRPAERFTAMGKLADRAEQFAVAATANWRLRSLPACEITVDSPPDHVGLGVGTQLGLVVAAGLRRFLELPDVPVEVLAQSVGRGLRSAVGTHGFRHGGLIVDAGKEPGQPLGRLAKRMPLPAAWRIVLVRTGHARGHAGDFEVDAFRRLPPVPDKVTRELRRITKSELIPALDLADCAAFGQALYRFGRLAGECFAPVQGGLFASPEIARLVEAIRSFGVPGVGQSSWGPTVFAFTSCDDEAQRLCEWLRQSPERVGREITIARPNNCGAQLSAV